MQIYTRSWADPGPKCPIGIARRFLSKCPLSPRRPQQPKIFLQNVAETSVSAFVARGCKFDFQDHPTLLTILSKLLSTSLSSYLCDNCNFWSKEANHKYLSRSLMIKSLTTQNSQLLKNFSVLEGTGFPSKGQVPSKGSFSLPQNDVALSSGSCHNSSKVVMPYDTLDGLIHIPFNFWLLHLIIYSWLLSHRLSVTVL